MLACVERKGDDAGAVALRRAFRIIPAGFESNWIPGVPGKAWFCYFRLYAPTEPHFDGAWVLPDFERMQ